MIDIVLHNNWPSNIGYSYKTQQLNFKSVLVNNLNENVFFLHMPDCMNWLEKVLCQMPTFLLKPVRTEPHPSWCPRIRFPIYRVKSKVNTWRHWATRFICNFFFINTPCTLVSLWIKQQMWIHGVHVCNFTTSFLIT